MNHDVTLIVGDGTGPELAAAARMCIDATGVRINWDVQKCGKDLVGETGEPLIADVLSSVARTRCALKSPISTPVGEGYRSVNLRLRQELELFACIRPCKSYLSSNGRTGIDMVVIGENTEDLYTGIEFKAGTNETAALIDQINRGSGGNRIKTGERTTGISIKQISHEASERIAHFACRYARKHHRSKITIVHKANIMKYTDGLFLDRCRIVAEQYPDLTIEERTIDNTCMRLVQTPYSFDVILLPQLYADIVSDICAGLAGGPGVAPGANVGENCAIFEANHGSAPKYQGLNIVNPAGMILSGVLMLHHLGEHEMARRLEEAVARVVNAGDKVTRDLQPKNSAGTREMAEAICHHLG